MNTTDIKIWADWLEEQGYNTQLLRSMVFIPGIIINQQTFNSAGNGYGSGYIYDDGVMMRHIRMDMTYNTQIESVYIPTLESGTGYGLSNGDGYSITNFIPILEDDNQDENGDGYGNGCDFDSE